MLHSQQMSPKLACNDNGQFCVCTRQSGVMPLLLPTHPECCSGSSAFVTNRHCSMFDSVRCSPCSGGGGQRHGSRPGAGGGGIRRTAPHPVGGEHSEATGMVCAIAPLAYSIMLAVIKEQSSWAGGRCVQELSRYHVMTALQSGCI
jgi:hypothetical protein